MKYRVVSESCYDMAHAKRIRNNAQAGSIETGYTGRFLVVFGVYDTLEEANKSKNKYDVKAFVQKVKEGK